MKIKKFTELNENNSESDRVSEYKDLLTEVNNEIVSRLMSLESAPELYDSLKNMISMLEMFDDGSSEDLLNKLETINSDSYM